jgi:hypothetical protein
MFIRHQGTPLPPSLGACQLQDLRSCELHRMYATDDRTPPKQLEGGEADYPNTYIKVSTYKVKSCNLTCSLAAMRWSTFCRSDFMEDVPNFCMAIMYTLCSPTTDGTRSCAFITSATSSALSACTTPSVATFQPCTFKDLQVLLLPLSKKNFYLCDLLRIFGSSLLLVDISAIGADFRFSVLLKKTRDLPSAMTSPQSLLSRFTNLGFKIRV